MDNKTLSIVSYFTLIGWLVSFFVGKEKADDLLKYHLKQSFGLLVLTFSLGIIINIVSRIVPTLAGILSFLYLVLFVFWLIGVINAASAKQKPLPLIGAWADKAFTFLN
ncbi:DUF4870 domain-containing protein [Myroides sp. N17-2]|uniref:DUF4870 domain-containing protein n=1 Tax=Myroides sp. N17-2 TaxID=2030799 RepID=UPI000EFBEF82|nr:DUF4870 domain-containing protein [Myroides sp. N17-2]